MGGSEAEGPSAKRAKTSEPEEEKEDPLVRRREELILQGASAALSLRAVCAKLQAKNEKLLGRLPPELWKKILDENLHQNDLVALAMTCRFFREKQKDLGWNLETNVNASRVLEVQKSRKLTPHTLGWFQWVCDTFKFLPGFQARGSMERVKRAVYEGDLLNYAALLGSVEILRWLMEEKGWSLNEDTGWLAGLGGSVEVLEYLKLKGYEFDEETCAYAAQGGSLEALKFLRAQDPPCPWNEVTCAWAAGGGHLDVLKWLRAQDPPCPWNEETCADAAAGGHLDVLKWARAQNPPCPLEEDWPCAYAAYGGHLEVLKWLLDQDPPCDGEASVMAARGGHLEVLRWLKDQDLYDWDRHKCREEASQLGHQHIVKWIDQQKEDESDDEEYSDGD